MPRFGCCLTRREQGAAGLADSIRDPAKSVKAPADAARNRRGERAAYVVLRMVGPDPEA